MADDAENPDPSTAVSTTEQQVNAAPAPSRATQRTHASARAKGSDPISKLIGMDDLKDIKKLLIMASAEFLGTFFLVYLGVSACVFIPGPPLSKGIELSFLLGVKITLVALVFGFAVATIAQMLGHVSGAHLNPAVSFGLVAAGECGIIKAGIYFFAQIFGAIFGALVVQLTVMPKSPKDMPPKMAALQAKMHPGITDSLSITEIFEWQALLIEMLITFPLIFVILAVCDKGNNMKGSAALAIGLAIALGHLVAIKPTGSSMNPARSIGPLIIALGFKKTPPTLEELGEALKEAKEAMEAMMNKPGPGGRQPRPDGMSEMVKNMELQVGGVNLKIDTSMEQIWIYLIGPILGGVFAGLLYRFVYNFEKQGITNDKKEGEGEDKQ